MRIEAPDFYVISDSVSTKSPKRNAAHLILLQVQYFENCLGMIDNEAQTGHKMGTFYTRARIENVTDRSKSVVLPSLLVDTGSEYTWAPASSLEKIDIDREKKDVLFVMANGHR